MSNAKKALGAWGEQVAADYLRQQGYRVVQKNFRTRRGEIDLIGYQTKLHHGETLCFIEVKTRSYGAREASAERAVGQVKQQHVQAAAKRYCQQKNVNIENTPISFEVVSIYRTSTGEPLIKHFDLPIF